MKSEIIIIYAICNKRISRWRSEIGIQRRVSGWRRNFRVIPYEKKN